MKAWSALAWAVAIGGAIYGVLAIGVELGEGRAHRKHEEQLALLTAERDALAVRLADAGAAHEAERARIQGTFAQLRVDLADARRANPGLVDCSLDPERLRIWNAANANAGADRAAEPGGAVPAAATGQERPP